MLQNYLKQSNEQYERRKQNRDRKTDLINLESYLKMNINTSTIHALGIFYIIFTGTGRKKTNINRNKFHLIVFISNKRRKKTKKKECTIQLYVASTV